MPPKTISKRHRGWVFTLNHYTLKELELIQAVECKHLIYGKEISASGTPHLQGYIEVENPMGLKAMCKLLGGRVHLEARLGTHQEARDYCAKGKQPHEEWKLSGNKGPSFGIDADIFEKGTICQQGKRSDIINVRNAALTQSMAEIVMNPDYNYQDIMIAKEVRKHCGKARDWLPEVVWISGLSGEGKSTFALEYCKSKGHTKIYSKSDGGKWWDGYDGEEAVALDDFRDSWWPLSYNNNMLTAPGFRVESKGSSTFFVPKLIVYSAILGPEKQYKGIVSSDEPLKQLLRRISLHLIASLDENGRTVYDFKRTEVNTVPFKFDELIKILKSDQRSGRVIVREPPVTLSSASAALPDSSSTLRVDDSWFTDENFDDEAGYDNVNLSLKVDSEIFVDNYEDIEG